MRDYLNDPRFKGIKPFEKKSVVVFTDHAWRGNVVPNGRLQIAGEIIATNAVGPYNISTLEN